MMINAIRPPASPARMGCVGNAGITDGDIDVISVVELVRSKGLGISNERSSRLVVQYSLSDDH
jgi:hypothetical protein